MFLTVKEVAERLGYGEKFVRELIKDGKLQAYRPTPRRTRVDEDAIQAYLNRYRTT